MKTASLALAATLAAATALPAGAMAQAQGTAQGQQQAAAGATDYREVDDLRVVGPDGKKIGEVENVLVDSRGQLAFVVEFDDGFLGMGEREVIVPADRMTFDAQNRTYSSDLAEADLKSLQTWDD